MRVAAHFTLCIPRARLLAYAPFTSARRPGQAHGTQTKFRVTRRVPPAVGHIGAMPVQSAESAQQSVAYCWLTGWRSSASAVCSSSTTALFFLSTLVHEA